MINILYTNPLQIHEGQLLGCWHAWATVFDVNPTKNWKDYQFPKHHSAVTLNNLVNPDSRKIFGLDAILRSIKQFHTRGVSCDTMQATGNFVLANNNYFINVNALGLNGGLIQGASLSDLAIQSWNNLTRSEKIIFLEFGMERLNWILNHTGINPSGLVFPHNFYNP